MDIFSLSGVVISVLALWIAWRTLKLTQDSLAITKTAVEQARKDWAQQKWFDLYFKADRAYNALDDFSNFNDSLSKDKRKALLRWNLCGRRHS